MSEDNTNTRNPNLVDPFEALQKAEAAAEHKVKRNFGGAPSPLPKYKDVIATLRSKGFTFEMVSEFLKAECGVEHGAGPQTIRNYLVEEGLYEPPTRNVAKKEDTVQTSPNEV